MAMTDELQPDGDAVALGSRSETEVPAPARAPQFGGRLAELPWAKIARDASVILLAVILLYPVIEVIRLAIDDGVRVVDRIPDLPRIGNTIMNTIGLALGVVVLSVVSGTALAWCAAQLRGRLNAIATLLSIFPILIPGIAGAVGWVFIFAPNTGYGNQLLRQLPFIDPESVPFNIYSLGGIIGVTTLYLVPYTFLFMSTALRELDPSMEDAARVSGSSWLGAQLRVNLAAMRPALVYSAVISLLLGLGQFTAALLLGRNGGIDVITTEMFRQMTVVPIDRPVAAGLAVPLIAIALVLVAIQRRIIGSGARYAGVGKGVSRVGRQRVHAIWPVIIYGGIAIVPPIAALVVVALSPYWQGTIDPSLFNIGSFQALFDNVRIRDSIWNTIEISVVATVVALVLSLALGLLMTRSKSRLRALVDFVVNLPLSVPALVFGIGVFSAYALGGPRLYGTQIIYIVTFVIILLPHGMRMITSGLLRLGDDTISAARVSGASALAALAHIVIPLLRRTLGAAGVLLFVLMTSEFAAAAVLKTPGNQVMSTQLFELWETGSIPQVAALALVMVGISCIGVLSILLVSGKETISDFE